MITIPFHIRQISSAYLFHPIKVITVKDFPFVSTYIADKEIC